MAVLLSAGVIPEWNGRAESSDTQRPFSPGPEGRADAADAQVGGQRITELVGQLGAVTRAERVAAEAELLQLGPSILDLLPPPDLLDSAAAREALRRLRVQLELQAAEQSVQASRVTLTGSRAAVATTAEIARQTGNAIRWEASADAGSSAIELSLDGVPFWRAVEEVARAAGVGWRIDEATGAVLFVDGPAAADRLSVSAGCAYAVAVQSVQYRGNAVRVEFQVLAEPRLRPLFVAIADADFTAATEAERLSLFSPKARTELPMTSRSPAQFAVLFQQPGAVESAQPLGVEGKVVVHTAAAPTEVRFNDLTARAPVARRRGGVTVTLERVRWPIVNERPAARIRMSIAYDAGGPEFESHRTWIYHNEVYLETPDGERYPVNDGFDTTAQANGGVALEYRFKDLPDRPPSDWQLVYVAPTLLVDVPVEFAFPDLKLPADAER